MIAAVLTDDNGHVLGFTSAGHERSEPGCGCDVLIAVKPDGALAERSLRFVVVEDEAATAENLPRLVEAAVAAIARR